MKQVTRHTCIVYRSVRNANTWSTVGEIAKKTALNPRTVRGIVKNLVEEGIFLHQQVHHGYRYRVNDVMDNAAKLQAGRIHEAEKIFLPKEVA
jgi:DNA-binding Lrp family transcriptional regulator